MGGLKYLIVAVLLSVCATTPLRAGTTEPVVADRYTGLALAGYDPVAYFVDANPALGRSDYELRLGQSVFRFRNEGNRAAFAANPEVYTPQFGGYDPIALARGVALEGNPLEWLIVDNRLYLFYSTQARAAFLVNPQGATSAAAEQWPGVARDLNP